jgi:hypothetical protein
VPWLDNADDEEVRLVRVADDHVVDSRRGA